MWHKLKERIGLVSFFNCISCNVAGIILNIKLQKSQATHVVQIRSYFNQIKHFIAVSQTQGRQEDLVSVYQRISFNFLCSHHTTTTLTNVWPQLFSLGFKIPLPVVFKLSHFHILSDLITYCFTLHRIIAYVTNPYFPTPVDKPAVFCYPYTVFPNVILMRWVNPVATCARVWPL